MQTCVIPDLRLPDARPGAPELRRAAATAPFPGAAPTSGPQPGPVPDPGPPPPASPPPPAYAPPPGYPSAPAPGYGYPAPPGYAYPPAASVAPDLQRTRKKRAFLLLPHLGLHTFQNGEKSTYDPGGRLGLILGGRVRDWFSLDADLTLDISNTHTPTTGPAFSQWWFDIAIGPLFQLPVGRIELVVGPKAGYFVSGAESRPLTGLTEHQRTSGFTFGLNAGLFVPIRAKTSVGGLLSYGVRDTQHLCRQTTGVESCSSVTVYDELFGASVGALF